VLEGRTAAGKAKFGKKRLEEGEVLYMLRVSEVTVDLCSTGSYVSDWRRMDPPLPTQQEITLKITSIAPNLEYAFPNSEV
jgi:hypothetical protein